MSDEIHSLRKEISVQNDKFVTTRQFEMVISQIQIDQKEIQKDIKELLVLMSQLKRG